MLKWIKNRKAREWAEIILEAAVIILVMFFVCWPYRLDGESMSPELNPGGRVLMSRALTTFNRFEKNDIIVCKIEINGQTKKIVKRLIGTPGDYISIFGGAVYVNGEPLHEDYVYGQKTSGSIDILLGEDEYFVLGDNRALSMDSRDFGAVQRKFIVGKVFFKFYPFGEIKLY